MEEFLQRAKSRLDRSKQLEKVHTVIGNKCCDLDSIISTLTYAYYLDKVSSPSVLCLPILNVARVEFNFYSETRFILEELDIPESCLIFRDEINLQLLKEEGRLSITLVNFSSLTSDDPALETCVVKVINPDKRCEVQACHESSSLVAKEIFEEAPELVTRQLAHLLRGSILFCCLSMQHDTIPEQEEIIHMLEEKFPELPPRKDIISSLQETKLHSQGTSFEDIVLKDFKELSNGDLKVAISTVHMNLEDLITYRNIIYDLKTFLDKYGFDVLLLLASYSLQDQATTQQVAVYSENPELFNQVCCELEECQNPFLDLEPSDYGCEHFFVYHQENSLATCDQVAAVIKEAFNRRRIGMVPNSRTSSTEAVAGSAPLSQGSSGIMELYGSDVDPQPNHGNYAENLQENNESAQAQVDINVDLVSPDSGLATIRSSRSSKESSVFLSDDSPVAEGAGPHHSFIPGTDSYSPIPEGVVIEEETPPSRNHSNNLDLFHFDVVTNIRSESSSHSADYSMADDFFFQSDSSEGPLPTAQAEPIEQTFMHDMANCSNNLLTSKIENISLVEFDNEFMQSPENCEYYCEKKPSVGEYNSCLSSEILVNLDIKVPPTPMNSLVESSPLDNGPPSFFPEDVIEKINEIGATSASQTRYACWWNGGEINSAQETLLNADPWNSIEQESVFHSPESWKDQKQNPSVLDNSLTKHSSSTLKVSFLDSQRANRREYHDIKTENTMFPDLWKSNIQLEVSSDPSCGSSGKIEYCAKKESIDVWCTSFDDENNAKSLRAGTFGKIDTDYSTENAPDDETQNIVCEELYEDNQNTSIHGGTENLKTKPQLTGLNSEAEIDGLKHIERNLCLWNVYAGNGKAKADETQITWDDPFLSYSGLDLTGPNIDKDTMISPPDTNYSTSDSNISPTSEDDMKKMEPLLDFQIQYGHGDHNSCSNGRDTLNADCAIYKSKNMNYSSAGDLDIGYNFSMLGTENAKLLSDRNVTINSEKRDTKDHDGMKNNKILFNHDSSHKDTGGEKPELSYKDFCDGVKGSVKMFQNDEKDTNTKLPITINHSNVINLLHKENQSNLAENTVTNSLSSLLLDANLQKTYETSLDCGNVNHNIQSDNLSTACIESQSSLLLDKVLNAQSEKSINNAGKIQSITPIHVEGDYTVNGSWDSQGILDTELQEDSGSSSLNTPEEFKSSSACYLENWEQFDEYDLRSTKNQENDRVPYVCATNSASVCSPDNEEISGFKANNEGCEIVSRRSTSSNSEANNTYQIQTSETFDNEKHPLNRKIQINENALFSNIASVEHLDSKEEDSVLHDKPCEDMWPSTVPSISESVETDSDLSSGASNIYPEHEQNIDQNSKENTLSNSSRSSSLCSDLDSSCGILQEGLHNTSICSSLPVSKNNEKPVAGIGSIVNNEENVVHNALNKVPMNLDIWNTPVCEDSESSSASPEIHEVVKHLDSSDEKYKNSFNENQSNSTTPGTDEEAEYSQMQFDLLFEGLSNVSNERLSKEVSSVENKESINNHYIPHTNDSLVRKLNSSEDVHQCNNVLESTEDLQKNVCASHSKRDPTYNTSKLNILDYSSDNVDWWNTEEKENNAYFISECSMSQDSKAFHKNWVPMQNACVNAMDISSKTDGQSSKNSYNEQDTSVLRSPLNNTIVDPLSNAAHQCAVKYNQKMSACDIDNEFINQVESCSWKQSGIASLEDCTLTDMLSTYDYSNIKDEAKTAENILVHNHTDIQEHEEICIPRANGVLVNIKVLHKGDNNQYISESFTDSKHSECISDILDSQECTSLSSLDPSLWKMPDQAGSKISKSYNVDNIQETFNIFDMCKGYENNLTDSQNFSTWSDSVTKSETQIEQKPIYEQLHDETLNQNETLWEENNTLMFADQGNHNAMKPEAVEYEVESLSYAKEQRDTNIMHLHINDVCDAVQKNEHVLEPGLIDQTVTTVNNGKPVFSFRCNDTINNPCIRESITYISEKATTEDGFPIKADLTTNVLLEHGTFMTHSINNEAHFVENIPLETTEISVEDSTTGSLALENCHQTDNKVEWTNYLSKETGDNGPLKECVKKQILENEVTSETFDFMNIMNEEEEIPDDNLTGNEEVKDSLESGYLFELMSGTKVNSFNLMETNAVCKQTESDKVYSQKESDRFQSISMTNDSEKQAASESEWNSLQVEDKPSYIIPQRLASEKKSEEISEQEHSWSIILNEAYDTSPEEIFSREETVDSDKELGESLYQEYFCEKGEEFHSEIKEHDYADLEESFEMCKLDEHENPLPNCMNKDDMQFQSFPEDGEIAAHLDVEALRQHRSLLDDVGMDIPFDAAESRPEPPNSLDLNGSHTRKIKLTAPNINLSLDHSEGSILSDDNIDTPDELDINVDDLDTPDEADSFDYTGHDDRPALGESMQEGCASIKEYTAEEEREDNRLWRTVVIGEQEQRIDMKAIEPYKKVISHGGYYGEGINAIIVFAACFLPDSSRADYNYVMENLFLYVISTLELMVAEDYMIVYLNGATPRRKMPGLGWMKKCYQMIDRRLRKNLKSFIIVHPSWFIRTILALTRPFISSKFSSKIKYVSTLAELREMIPMDHVHIPENIVKLDEELQETESAKAGCLPNEPEMTSLEQEFEKKKEENL